MELDLVLSDSAWLRRLTARLVDDPATADDIYQRTVLAALRSAEPVATPRSWLARVAHNFSLEDRRRRARRAVREAAAAKAEQVPSAAEMSERFEAQQAVAEAARALELKQREVVFLHYFEDLSLREIAAKTETPIETIRTRHKRAIAALRERLDDRFGSRAAWALPLLNARLLEPRLQAVHATAGTPIKAAAVFALVGLLTSVAFVWSRSSVRNDGPSQPTTPAIASAHESEVAAADGGGAASATDDEARRPTRETSEGDRAPELSLVVRGRVVAAESREPLPGVTLTLDEASTTASQDTAASDAWSAVARTAAEADGTFAFVTRATALGAALRVVVTADDRARHEHVFRIARAPEDANRELSVGDLEVAFGTTLVGRVETDDGRPAAATDVWILRAHGDARHLGTTGADGTFRPERPIASSPRGDRLLAVGPHGSGWRWLDLTRDASEQDAVVRLQPTASLVVRVVDAHGRPVSGSTVTYRPVPTIAQLDWADRAFGSDSTFARAVARRTDAGGEVSWPCVPVLGSSPHDEGWPLLVDVDTGRHEDHLARVRHGTRLVVVAGRASETIVELPKPAIARYAGRVTDANDDPVEGAVVELITTDTGRAATAHSDRAGRFELAPRAAAATASANVTMRVSAPDHLVATRSLTVDQAARGTVRIRLDRARTVYGTVRDEHGTPVPGAGIRLLDDSETTVSDATGSYCLRRVPLGSAAVEVAPPRPAYAWSGPRWSQLAPDRSIVDLDLVRTTERGATMRATIVDGESGEPIDVRQGVLCRSGVDPVIGLHPVRFGIGYLEAAGLPPGGWAILATAARGQSILGGFRVVDGRRHVELRFASRPTASVVGHVDLSDVPLAERDRSLTLMHSNVDAPLLWVDPETGGSLDRTARVLGNPHCVRLAPGQTRFRLDGLTTFRDRVDVFLVDSGRLVGGVEVPIEPAKRTTVRVRARLGTPVRFTWTGPRDVPNQEVWYRQRLHTDTGPAWDPWVSVGALSPADGQLELPRLVLLPGTYEWGISDERSDVDVAVAFGGRLWRSAPKDLELRTTGQIDLAGREEVVVRLRR